MTTFTLDELKAIYDLFDKVNVNGIESNELKLAVMKRCAAMLQEDARLKAELASAIKERKPDA